MSYQCPIVFKKIDVVVAKITTVLVLLLIGVYFFTLQGVVLLFLAFDFFVRLYGNKKFSLLHHLSLKIQKIAKFQPKMEDEGGRKLASFFELIFIIGLNIAHLLQLEWLAVIVASIFVGCALVDLIFGYCLACKIYSLAKKIYPE